MIKQVNAQWPPPLLDTNQIIIYIYIYMNILNFLILWSSTKDKKSPSSAKSICYFLGCLWVVSQGSGSSDKNSRMPQPPPHPQPLVFLSKDDYSMANRKIADTLGGGRAYISTCPQLVDTFHICSSGSWSHNFDMLTYKRIWIFFFFSVCDPLGYPQ